MGGMLLTGDTEVLRGYEWYVTDRGYTEVLRGYWWYVTDRGDTEVFGGHWLYVTHRGYRGIRRSLVVCY